MVYKTQLRISEDTGKKLKVISEKNCRSFNSQVEFILLQFIADYEKVNGKIDLTDFEE